LETLLRFWEEANKNLGSVTSCPDLIWSVVFFVSLQEIPFSVSNTLGLAVSIHVVTDSSFFKSSGRSTTQRLISATVSVVK
jgi:hypothetical protein